MIKEVGSIKYGYARVSTAGQDLDVQIKQLKDQGVLLENIYQEKATGTSKARPQLELLLEQLEENDEVIISKIDRLARSIIDLKGLVDELNNRGVTVTFLNDNLKFEPNNSNPQSNLMLNMLGSFAEFERDLIVSRTQEGKAHAKANNPNYKEGRPKRTLTPQYLHAIDVLKANSYTETEKKTGISRSTLQRIKKQYIEETGDSF